MRWCAVVCNRVLCTQLYLAALEDVNLERRGPEGTDEALARWSRSQRQQNMLGCFLLSWWVCCGFGRFGAGSTTAKRVESGARRQALAESVCHLLKGQPNTRRLFVFLVWQVMPRAGTAARQYLSPSVCQRSKTRAKSNGATTAHRYSRLGRRTLSEVRDSMCQGTPLAS